jgi:ribonuclease-3
MSPLKKTAKTPKKKGRPALKAVAKKTSSALEKKLQYTFSDRKLFERALTHRSMHGVGAKTDYESLEFLGDAVIDLVVAHLLIQEHPNATEGKLSKMRAALVRMESLAELAREIDLKGAIRLSNAEAAHGGNERPSLLSDVLEALIGAIYLDSGLIEAFKCVKRLFGEKIRQVSPRDPKTELQEALHALGKSAPEYVLEKIDGPEHAPTFVSLVRIEGAVLGKGKGNSKKASQQIAAEEALGSIKDNRFGSK